VMGQSQFFDAQVRTATSESGKFPSKIAIFSNFSPQIKKSSGWVKNYPCQGNVVPLFTAGQKYARVGSGPSLVLIKIFCPLDLMRVAYKPDL